MMLCTPVAPPLNHSSIVSMQYAKNTQANVSPEPSQIIDAHTGTLSPVLIEHTARGIDSSTFYSVRTDIAANPSSEVFLPVGAEGNLYSVDCTDGHFLVGAGGLTDFGSPEGTLSLWIKWDNGAPNGRFWGQHTNFETRWSSNRLVIDWGGDTTLQGTKNNWIVDKWYFIAITWNQDTNSLGIYWGDEELLPIEDASSSIWTGSVIGLLSENDIMCSRGSTSYRVDGHVDDFRYYSVERSIDDLQSDYKTPLIGDEPYLEHYYNFENNLLDSAGTSNLMQSGTTFFSQDVVYEVGGWQGEQIEVDIQELHSLYALYGSFETGLPGTNVDWNGDGTYYANGWRARRDVITYQGRQRTSYTSTGSKYITLENEGYEDPSSPNAYRHYNSTYIYWYQNIDNSDQAEEFEFSMSYLYQRGPIGSNFSGNFMFSFEIFNGSLLLWNWSIDPTEISQRGLWYVLNPIPVELPSLLSSFQARISLNVNTSSSYIEIPDDDSDLDGDSANGMFITFQVDDISLISVNTPSFESVELEIDTPPLGTIPVNGSTGSTTILLNYSYWDKAAIPFSFSSNSSISFEFSARVSIMSRYSNSTFSQNLEHHGIAYDIELNQNASLSFYTYMPSYSGVTDIGFIVSFPKDWSDPLVEDPFGHDVSDIMEWNCGCIEAPPGSVGFVGWWKISLNGPNYAKSLATEQHTCTSWVTSAGYRSNDQLRTRAVIGSSTSYPKDVIDAEFVWYNPSGNPWYSCISSSSNTSTVISSSTTFGANNASVGIWSITLFWNNGTEIGFGLTQFQLFHRLTIFPQTPSFEIEPGESFTAAIFLYDHDNGNPILSDATIVGNWSTETIQFNPNLAKGWWEADFNSSAIGTGDFVVVIFVTLDFYETESCTINLQIPLAESLAMITLRASILGAISVAVFFAVLMGSRRLYLTTKTRRRLELLELKARLEDAKNIIGLLVIHRSMGLSIYSRIIKGGFEESMLSSFISALSQFRAEFSWDEPKLTAIPITEVITAVLTDTMICALITVENASDNLKTQLESFGREMGSSYDEDDATLQKMAKMSNMNESIDRVFETHFDCPLMDRYIGIKTDIPKHLMLLSDLFETVDVDTGLLPDAMIKSIIVLGQSEKRAYELVFEAIDQGYLIVAEQEPPSTTSSKT